MRFNFFSHIDPPLEPCPHMHVPEDAKWMNKQVGRLGAHRHIHPMLLLHCAPCPKASLSEPQKGPEPSLSLNYRAEGQREGQVAKRLGPHRSCSFKGHEKRWRVQGGFLVRTVVSQGMYLWMKGHRAGEAADKRLFIYQIRSVNIYPKLTKVPTTPNAHCHCIPSFQGKGDSFKIYKLPGPPQILAGLVWGLGICIFNGTSPLPLFYPRWFCCSTKHQSRGSKSRTESKASYTVTVMYKLCMK